MTPEALARLHAACFVVPRPWSAEDIADVLASPGAALFLRPEGFAIGRTAAGEAELLTLAVDPARRRRGVGTALLAAFDAGARAHGAAEAVLEVAERNAAARALYEGAGLARGGAAPALLRRRAGRAGAAQDLVSAASGRDTPLTLRPPRGLTPS